MSREARMPIDTLCSGDGPCRSRGDGCEASSVAKTSFPRDDARLFACRVYLYTWLGCSRRPGALLIAWWLSPVTSLFISVSQLCQVHIFALPPMKPRISRLARGRSSLQCPFRLCYDIGWWDFFVWVDMTRRHAARDRLIRV